MANNFATTGPVSGGADFASDDVSDVHYQRIKITDGEEDSTKVLDVVVDDEAIVSGDSGLLAFAVATPSTGSVGSNDSGYLAMSTDRRLHVDADIGNTVTVTATNLDCQSGGADMATAAGQLVDGHNVTVDNANLKVDLGADNDVTITSGTVTAVTDITNTIDSTISGAALTALQVIDNPVLVEDVAFSGGSVMMAGAIRDDSLSGLSPAEGDAVPLRVGSTGALHVTGGGGGTEYTEDVVTANPIVGTATMMERDDVLTTAVAEADWLAMKSSAEGALWVQDFNSDAVLADTAAMVVDLAAIEVTQDALVVDAAAMEVLLTNIDSDTNTIQSDTTEILSDTASIQTAVEIIDNIVHVDDAAFTLGTHSGVMMMGFAGTQSVDANDAGAVAMDTDGAIHISDGGNVITVDGTITEANSTAILADTAAIDTATAAMVVDLAAIEVTQDALVVDLAAIEVTQDTIASAVHADAATYTDSTSLGMGCYGVHQATPDTVADNDFSPILLNASAGQLVELQAGAAAVGTVGVTASATGGMSYDMLALAAEDNDKVIKGSAGTIYFISIQSIDATPVYLKLFNATSITPGTTAADLQYLCPSQGTALGAGLVLNFGTQGIQFGTGIVALVATGAALDDNTAVSANEVFVTIGFE